MTESKVPYITLSDGGKIPQLGCGTWTLKEDAVDVVKMALAAGCRSIDTAELYGNEEFVGKGIRESGIPREDIFLTTKISPDAMRHPPQKQWIDESLKNLDCGYIDLLLIHWSIDDHNKETWETMEEYVDKGLVKHIGVSNFHPHHLDDLLAYAKIRPVVDQLETHPYNTQQSNIKACHDRGVAVECWSPLAQGRVMKDPVITKIAEAHKKNNAQITLRWEIQRGLITIPKFRNPVHIQQNMDIFDFELTDEEMKAITALNENKRCNPLNDPENCPW